MFCICVFVEFAFNRRSDPLPESGVLFLLRFALTNASEFFFYHSLPKRKICQVSVLLTLSTWFSGSLFSAFQRPYEEERREPGNEVQVVTLSAQFTSSVIYYARQHVLCEEVRKLTVTSFMLRWRLIEKRVELNSLLYNDKFSPRNPCQVSRDVPSGSPRSRN